MATSSNNVTSAFIDLATYDEPDKFTYGGCKAITYFARCIKKATWFSQIPITARLHGTADFDSDFSGNISRAGDVLLHAWVRFRIPDIANGGAGTVAWINNLAHHIFSEITLSFNDIVSQKLDGHWLDFWSNFTLPESKYVGYQNMIGNTADLTTPAANITGKFLTLPLPFFFSRDSGIGLTTAALPYNDMKVSFRTRRLADSVILAGGATLPTGNITNFQLWLNYAIVTNEERCAMGDGPRDMLIEQVQHTATTHNAVAVATILSHDIRFSYQVKALFWAARNRTAPGTGAAAQFSNYTTNTAGTGADPLDTTSLVYENTFRHDRMGSDHFSLVEPFYKFTRIPTVTGLHAYSYALKPESVDPTGSTNYSKLNNVSMQVTYSAAAAGTNFELIIRGLSMIIARISGGAFGFPAL